MGELDDGRHAVVPVVVPPRRSRPEARRAAELAKADCSWKKRSAVPESSSATRPRLQLARNAPSSSRRPVVPAREARWPAYRPEPTTRVLARGPSTPQSTGSRGRSCAPRGPGRRSASARREAAQRERRRRSGNAWCRESFSRERCIGQHGGSKRGSRGCTPASIPREERRLQRRGDAFGHSVRGRPRPAPAALIHLQLQAQVARAMSGRSHVVSPSEAPRYGWFLRIRRSGSARASAAAHAPASSRSRGRAGS